MKKVIVITGPTGVGKSKLALTLAKYFNGEIVNADASQFYKKLNIGTAKVTPAEQSTVKHHLIDFLDIGDPYSIKDFQEQARSVIEKIDLPFVVGGSGLYIQATIADYQLRGSKRDVSQYEGLDNQGLHQLLQRQNPEAAKLIHPNNRRRILRYLERGAEDSFIAPSIPNNIYDVLLLCLVRPREQLYEQINRRCEAMIADGWIEECRELQQQGFDLSTIKEIGYAEIGLFLDDKQTLEATIEQITQKTRRYAKRQMTWFRNKMHCIFVDLSQISNDTIVDMITRFIQK